ncbi:S8 family serine peptidase [Nocardioidaceae bacterium]|nr:S8 family serine peptidase [Nocardioidaceae bacterium]
MPSIRHTRATAGLAALATAAFGAVALSPSATAAGPAVEPGAAPGQADRFIVSFERGRAAEARSAIREAKGRVVLDIPGRAAVAAVVPEGNVADLRRQGAVGYVEVDALRTPVSLMPSAAKPDGSGNGKGGKPAPSEPTDPGTATPPSAQDVVGADGETLPYGIQTTQAGEVSAPAVKKVCIIDSGYYAGHEDLRDPGDGVTGSNDPGGTGPWNSAFSDHGTHVAGTIAGTDNAVGVVGAFPNAALHIVRVFGDDGTYAYSSTLVAALDDCVANGADVVSMSLGGSQKSRLEDQAFSRAYSNGVLSIAAAGNDGNTRTSYPAGYGSVVSVAAVDENSAHADFSQVNSDVEIAAPGVGVLSTVPSSSVSTLTLADGSTLAGGAMEGSANGSATGTLVDGGLCDTSSPAWAGKVVLCQRGTITFEEKVDNVIAGGGTGAAIYNNVAGGFSSTLGAEKSIPAISLSDTQGVTAQGALGSTVTVANQTTRPANGYEKYDGTSMATPHVSAIAAEIWSTVPTASAAQVRDAINSTAFDLGAEGRDSATGFGLIQAADALAALR